MKKLIIPLLLLAGLIVGCDSPEKAKAFNQSSVNNPEFVAKMPDGRSLYCVQIDRAELAHYHYVYYFGNDDVKTISINSEIKSGKTSYNEVIVVNGREYHLVEK
jgi:uncharacterized protein YcfL